MRVSDVVIIILVCATTLLGLGIITNDLSTKYGVEIGENFTEYTSFVDDINKTTGKIAEDLSGYGEEGKWSFFGQIVSVPAMVVRTIGLVIKSIGYSLSIYMDIVVDSLKIPLPIVSIGFTVIVVLISFTIIGWLRRYKS